MAKLVAIGDSLTQGFQSLAIQKTNHTYPAMIGVFGDLKRSTAIFKLAMWKRNGILSGENFEELTEETQKRIDSICNIER